MTERALEDMRLVQAFDPDPKRRKVAEAIANDIRRMLDLDYLPKHAPSPHPRLTVDRENLSVISDYGMETRISSRCFDVLSVFLNNVGEVISRDDFVEQVPDWRGKPPAYLLPALKTQVSDLRYSLKLIGLQDPVFKEGYILTVGKGYVLVNPHNPLQVDTYKEFASVPVLQPGMKNARSRS